MAHLRPRHLEAALQKTLNFSPIIGVVGHRQVGKTTLLERMCASYETLDSKSSLKSATEDPEAFVAQPGKSAPFGIDECQLAPELFPALKERVRQRKKPGQFILSGSIRFTSRKAIRESLTGRIINFELLPFTLSELEAEPLLDVAPRALESPHLASFLDTLNLRAAHLNHRAKLMRDYYVQGGLPGVCFVRDSKLRDMRIDAQFETLLDRDLRLVQKTTLPFGSIKNLCAALARSQGAPVEYTTLQEASEISTPTIKKLIYALEGIFLIRTLRVEGGRKGLVVFFEDQAEAHRLAGGEHSALARMTHFLFNQLRAQFEYRLGASTEVFQYRTRGGAVLPLCFRNSSGTLGIIPVESETQAGQALGSANSFLQNYANAKVLILHPGKEARLVQPRVLIAPVGAVV